MRRNVVVAVLTAALVGVVGAEGIMKARDAALPKGTVTVEQVFSVGEADVDQAPMTVSAR